MNKLITRIYQMRSCTSKIFCVSHVQYSNTSDKSINEKTFQEKIDFKMGYWKDEIKNAPYINEYLKLMEEMEKRKVDTRKIKIFIIVVAVGFLVVSYDFITSWASEQATVITTKSLNDDKFKKDVNKFCEDIIGELIKSEKVQNDLKVILKIAALNVISDTETKNQFKYLVVSTLNSDEIKNSATLLSEGVIKQLLFSNDYEHLRDYISKYLNDETNKVINSNNLQANVSKLARKTLSNIIFGAKDNDDDSSTKKE